MPARIINHKNKIYGKWRIVSMDGVDTDRHRLWNAVNIKTGEKRLISSANILAIKKRSEKLAIKKANEKAKIKKAKIKKRNKKKIGNKDRTIL